MMLNNPHGLDKIGVGLRVKVFDARLFKRDDLTPLSFTERPATVIKRYGLWEPNQYHVWRYADLIDVEFDHNPGVVSRGHFTYMVKLLTEEKRKV